MRMRMSQDKITQQEANIFDKLSKARKNYIPNTYVMYGSAEFINAFERAIQDSIKEQINEK